MKIRIPLAALSIIAMVLLSSCESADQNQEQVEQGGVSVEEVKTPVEPTKAPEVKIPDKAEGIVTVKVETNMGVIVLDLNSKEAPITVANFVQYVKGGAYDGTIFHRVIKGFMIQGGGFTEERVQKESGATIKNETKATNRNKRGSIAMARMKDLDSASNQFFINHDDNSSLDTDGGYGGYAVFGEVVEGMDVVDAIAGVKTGTATMTARDERGGTVEMNKRPFRDVPVTNVVIKKMSVVGSN